MRISPALLTVTALAGTLIACAGEVSGTGSGTVRSDATAQASSTSPTRTEPPEPEPGSSAGTYEQTWKSAYDATPCADFLRKMSDHQRWVMASDLLTEARRKDGAQARASQSESTRFEAGLAVACEGSSDTTVTDVGITLYRLDPSYHP
ncbi:hypothetical protein ACFVT5_41545 [Streptomyces sp. NPDC058001]|uniref:hypothetical protein n=1 Tax=Streptomyces sp. NPDC058001 TaxID=3346300 RepID=UPI0036E9638C